MARSRVLSMSATSARLMKCGRLKISMSDSTTDECDHGFPKGTTMFVGKVWECMYCGQQMICVSFGEHEEIQNNDR
jgi:hypothetical protein